MAFKDHFSRQSSDYSRYRPHYPAELFDFLQQHSADNAVALDCATGSGQAAGQLAQHFAHVVASDASLAQLQHAQTCHGVNYLRCEAEAIPLSANSLDLIGVAQAAHWFDLEHFYAEVDRALKPGGVLAVWCYGLFETEPEINAIIEDYYGNILKAYWPDERKWVEQGYRSLDFPYAKIATPKFYIEANWSLDDVIGYLQSWSATQAYIEVNGSNPLTTIKNQLQAHWPTDTAKRFQWPIHLLMGRKS